MGSSVSHLLYDPYADTDISLIIPTVDFSLFVNLYESLLKGYTKHCVVEMLLKLDDTNQIDKYLEICQSSPFQYKILMYPRFNGRCSLHHFFNDLGSISSGKIVWILNDDAMVHGEWDRCLMSTRNKFKDNIYAIVVPYDNGKGSKQIVPLPAITQEWIALFRSVTKFPNYDRWIHEISKGISRRIVVEDVVVSMPKGHRVLSKQDRKNIFFPLIEKYLKKYKGKLK